MAKIVSVSEAASLALHACLRLGAGTERLVSAREIAEALQVSEAHLAKVLQRLVSRGLLESTRGVHGGFRLARPPREISLLEIFEAMEGPVSDCVCLFNRRFCVNETCIFGALLSSLHLGVKRYLRTTTLATLASSGAGRRVMKPRNKVGAKGSVGSRCEAPRARRWARPFHS